MSRSVSSAAAVIAAMWFAAPAGVVFAQPPAADPTGAAAPGNVAAPASAAPPAPAAAPAALPPTTDAAPGPSGPLVTYVKHTKPPFMIDTTIAANELGMIGALASIAAGHDIVTKNDIQDPSSDIARGVALAYAASQGGHVADAPISDDQMPANTKPDALGRYAGGARYVVDVAPASLDIIYFVTDPLRRDLTLRSSAAIVDASTGKTVARAHCFIKQSKDGERFNHDTLLADQAAALKAILARKSQACVDELEAGLKIAPAPPPPPAN
jgi:hypothetical protein